MRDLREPAVIRLLALGMAARGRVGLAPPSRAALAIPSHRILRLLYPARKDQRIISR